jgi:hypothetical protein
MANSAYEHVEMCRIKSALHNVPVTLATGLRLNPNSQFGVCGSVAGGYRDALLITRIDPLGRKQFSGMGETRLRDGGAPRAIFEQSDRRFVVGCLQNDTSRVTIRRRRVGA